MQDDQGRRLANRVQKALTSETSARKRRAGYCREMMKRLGDGIPPFIQIPLGVVLALGGLIGFLPFLGFWMLPLGLAILARHFPFAGRLLRTFVRASARIRHLLRRRRGEKTPVRP